MKVKMNVIKTTKYVIYDERGCYQRGFSNEASMNKWVDKQIQLGHKGSVEQRDLYEKVTKQSRGFLFQEEHIVRVF